MKYLIVNADDFGASHAINLGILEAHRSGIVTSTSLMVDTAWSAEAALLSREAPDLSVGLHADLEAGALALPGERCRDELRRQLTRFEELMGHGPTHIDSHRNVHRAPELLAWFLEVSREWGLPLREHSPARYYPHFYGRWGGESHPEQVSVESLSRMLEREVRDGITELSCHPGRLDPGEASSYAVERQLELETLCEPRIRAALQALEIHLVSYHDLGRLVEA